MGGKGTMFNQNFIFSNHQSRRYESKFRSDCTVSFCSRCLFPSHVNTLSSELTQEASLLNPPHFKEQPEFKRLVLKT